MQPNANKVRAVYKDGGGKTYPCPIELRDGAWVMVTSDGTQPITFYFDDDIGGRLEFVEYRKESDPRLHIEPRQPGQSSFRQLQEANVARINAERKQREQARAEAQNAAAAHTDANARDLNAQFAQRKKPRGGGAGLVVTPPLMHAELDAALKRGF